MGRYFACMSALCAGLKRDYDNLLSYSIGRSDREEELMLATLYCQWYNRAYDSCSDF